MAWRSFRVLNFLWDVVSAGVRVSWFSWSVGVFVAVNLATKVAAPRPSLTFFWNFLHKK